MLGLKFAYATNGHEILEFNYFTGKESVLTDFPGPDELWRRYRAGACLTDDTAADRLLTPMNFSVGKGERYYQQIAINRAVEGILKGQRWQLITMATGTGKTPVAFQICWKLWNSRWNRTGEHRRPKILYLADRNILVDDPKDKMFATFGDARHKVEGGKVVKSREIYFAIYQSLAEDGRRPGLYKEFAPDFFDLIIVDECHRGSAREDSTWRDILTWFKPAFQLGLTATPLREDNRDTYLYFGNPIYTYSLRDGIDDGFLAPYRVHRVISEWDAAGWRPSKGELDRYGRSIPDEEYQTKDFERVVALRARTEAIAKHLTAFLKKTDRYAKTIVFCVDQEHASEMRAALNNLNRDLAQQLPNYVCRVTADEGDIGRGHLGRFQDVESMAPVILTTSQLLTKGVDAPTCKNVVLARVVGSMTEFKQIIGRGTRVRDDYGKLWFNIIDYTGSATRMFADPAFDGDPVLVTEEEINAAGEPVNPLEPDEPPPDESDDSAESPDSAREEPHNVDPPRRRAAQALRGRGQRENRHPPRLRNRSGRETASGGSFHRRHGQGGAHHLPRRPRTAETLGRPGATLGDHRSPCGAWHRVRRTGCGGKAARRRPVRPPLPPRLQRPAPHPPGTRPASPRGPQRLLRPLRPRSPSHPGPTPGKIHRTRHRPVCHPRRAEGSADFAAREH